MENFAFFFISVATVQRHPSSHPSFLIPEAGIIADLNNKSRSETPCRVRNCPDLPSPYENERHGNLIGPLEGRILSLSHSLFPHFFLNFPHFSPAFLYLSYARVCLYGDCIMRWKWSFLTQRDKLKLNWKKETAEDFEFLHPPVMQKLAGV